MFKILDAQLAHANTFLEIVMDDNLFPAYSTAKARSANYTFNETGDAMIRELDLSRMTLRLVSQIDNKGEGDDDEIKAKVQGPTLDTLKRALYTPTSVSLKDAHGKESKVTVSMRFLPVKMTLDPSESFNNAGNLRVEVLDGSNLPAADRNGYSDPYCKFLLNGTEVFKTKTQKKTLHPVWNESFDVPVRSRTAAVFKAEVYDWDFADKADWLGAASIPLSELEPFKTQEATLHLDGKSGDIRLRMLFKPDYVTRSRQGSSTFSGTFNAGGKIVGAPVKGVAAVGGVAVGGVSKGANFFTKGFKRQSSSQHAPQPSQDTTGGLSDVAERNGESPAVNGHAEQPAVGGLAAAGMPGTPHKRESSFGQVSQSPAAEQGTASVSVLSASGFKEDTKLEIRIIHDSPKGLKEVLKTKVQKAKTGEATFEDESKKVPCNADHGFRVQVKDHHTMGSKDLGEGSFFINDQASGGTQEVAVGSGKVAIQSSFQPNDAQSLRPLSSAPDSPASRKPGGLNRFMSRRDRSVTPSG